MKTPTPAELEQFRKLDQVAQLKSLRGTKVERKFVIERDGAIDQEARTAWLSIASEEPYERWWGIEILDVSKDAIRDARLKSGAPLLVGHDSDRQVGVVEAYEITPAKKLRVLARFSKSAYAEEIWQDVLDGIRRNTSVGYIINDLVLERQQEDVSTYRVTDWEPLEASIVPVPADPTVGVGREHESPAAAAPKTKERHMDKTKEQIEQEAKAAADKAASDARVAEQKRTSDLLNAGVEYKDFGGPEVALELVKDPNATVETFRAKMLEKMRGRSKPTPTAQPAGGLQYGEGARVRMRYGKLRSFTRDLPLHNGQKMEAEEAAYRSGVWMAAAIYGQEWAHKRAAELGIPLFMQTKDGQLVETRVMGGNTNPLGGALVPVEMEQAIIDLRDLYGVVRKLVRVRPMASDQKSIPRRTGGVTAYFFNDEDGVGITASDKSWDNVNLVAKKLGALCRVSEDLEEDAIIDVVDDLAFEIGYAFAVKEDQCFIDGDGTSTYGGIQGFRPKFVATAYASRYTLASNHDTFAEVDTTDVSGVMGSVAAYGTPGAQWLVSNTGKAMMFDRIKAGAGGNDTITLGNKTVPAYLGYEIVTSEAMPAGPATDYSNLVMATFGRWDLAASLGNRRGITLQVLRERYAELGQIGIKGTERFDLVVHDLGSTTVKGPIAAMYGQ